MTTPITKEQLTAFRADGGDISRGRIKEIADNVYGDEEKRSLAQRLIASEDELQERRKTDKSPVHPNISSEQLDDETLQELIEFRRTTFEYHSKEGNKVQAIIHGVTLSALQELQERRRADSAEPAVFNDERNLNYIAIGRETSLIWGQQNKEEGYIPLYRHAQPAPVLPKATPSLKAMMQAMDAFYAEEEVPERGMLSAFRILLDDTCRTDVQSFGNLEQLEPISQRSELPAVGWIRADYHSDRRMGNAPVFILGKENPSSAWGIDYIPLTSNSHVILDV